MDRAVQEYAQYLAGWKAHLNFSERSCSRKEQEAQVQRALFCAFRCAYWAHHMKWLHLIDEVAKTFGHSYPLIPVRLMLVVDNLQELKTMQSSNFDNYKYIREVLPANDHENGIYGKDIENKQAKDFSE